MKRLTPSIAALMLGALAVIPVTAACSTATDEVEQSVDQEGTSDEMSGDTDNEETEADSDTEE